VSPAKKQAVLIILGARALTLALIVFVTNHNFEINLLAALGIVGAVAIIVVSLPPNGK
jgi:hypothetical protein